MAGRGARKGARRAAPRPKPPVGDLSDPRGMAALVGEYLAWLAANNYSEHTVVARRNYLRYFMTWCQERGVTQPREVTRPILERYQRWLFHYRKADGQPMSFRSQATRLVPVKSWFKWLARHNHVLYNPASELELPRPERRLPKHVLTADEAEAVLGQAHGRDPLSIRDRAILETVYSTGVRRMELAGLKVYDVDRQRGTVLIRQGKGKRDRLIPIGERALAWLAKYLSDVRPLLAVPPDDGWLFLTNQGDGFTPQRMSGLVKEYVQAAEVGKDGACHLFRHTMATLMLENGADIRFIQALLGHASLETTQQYTQLSIRKLQEVHRATHPAGRQEPGGCVAAASAALHRDQPGDSVLADELLADLTAEAEE